MDGIIDGFFYFRNLMLHNITIIIKTFKRKKILQELIGSIRKFYPSVLIYVADDSKNPVKPWSIDKYFKLPFDTGVSYGRNFLIKQVKTKYFLLIDDDSLFTKDTVLERPLKILENTSLDVVAGLIVENDKVQHFYGQVEVRNRLIKKNKYICGMLDGYPLYDYFSNFFVGRTETFKDNNIKWDDRLKICEHIEFWHRNKDKMKCTVLKDFRIIERNVRNVEYNKFRVDRQNYYIKLRNQIMGINEEKIETTCDNSKAFNL